MNKRNLLSFNFQNCYKNGFFSPCFQSLSPQRWQRLQLRPTVRRAAWQGRRTDHFALWELSSPNPSPSSSPPTTWHPAHSTATTLSAATPRAARSSRRALPSLPTLPWDSGAAALSVPRWGLRWEDLGRQVRTAASSWGRRREAESSKCSRRACEPLELSLVRRAAEPCSASVGG